MRNLKTEFIAALVTFSTMAYIVCVQPALMSGQMFNQPTGMPVGPLITTTCLVAGLATIIMGIWARFPIALAPGMGENFLVIGAVFPACAAVLGLPIGRPEVWQTAMGVVFISGLLFGLLSLCRLRTYLVGIISPGLKSGIAAGIGLFIAYLGLKSGGIIAVNNNLPQMAPLHSANAALFATGLCVAIACLSRKIPGGILWGILAAAGLAAILGKIEISPDRIVGLPANPMPILGKIDLGAVFAHLSELWTLILILTFMDVFDTLGTVIAVARQAGLTQRTADGRETIPRCERAFTVDALATMGGALCGHSTVTSFIESAAGVQAGGRTGWTAIFTGGLFLMALFLSPLITTLAACPAITASALVLVGIMMAGSVREIDWDDYSESVPAFLILVGIPFTGSIANGILLGFIMYPVGKALSGKGREVSIGFYLLAALLAVYVLEIM